MSFREPSLLYAVMAFAAGHLEAIGRLPGNSQHLIDRLHWNSIRHLRQLLGDSDSLSQAVALATTRTLCQAQIYGGTSLWRIHLDGARAILESSHVSNQLNLGGSRDHVNSEFLSSWFNNAEALAALSPTGLFNDQLQVNCHLDSGVFFDVFGGVMSDLPALFKAVGALVKENRKRTSRASQSTTLSDINIAREADTLIQEIHSRLDRDTAENLFFQSNMFLSLSVNEIQDYALSNAGFLYTALLHIYCGVRALSPLSSEVQSCVDQIIRCAQEMSCGSGLSPRVLLVAPLFTAGLCAVGNARESIRSALADIGKWMRTPHLSKTLALLENVWLECPDNSPDAWARGGFGELKDEVLCPRS
ncbi:hypothetical protein FSARC_442 [Fusarium sarcochroum]|uniref:Uncharacterized protein n=1 Tax=Fusarium sarcochroum TaxID=1208366 RepID=A0A8H4XG50_9HYPO|nr:hypothetical protein FSARC_442 [Fusarium sarcochroum]